MSLASVLVHVGPDTRSKARLDAAAALAAAHQAHLIGVFVIPPLDVPPAAQAYISPEFIAARKRAAEAEASEAEQTFRAVAEGEGVASEWRCEEGDVYDILPLHTRYADLAVVGQTAPESPGGDLFPGLPERVVMDSGRPVVIIPYAGSYRGFGKRALVAWNASREATRAVHDALPLLERAEQVTVLCHNPEDQPTIPGSDIAAHLARHGIQSEASESYNDELDPGDALLSRAFDLGADLMVMGAYGHSRARELILGGVTRHILQHMTMPVLMSH